MDWQEMTVFERFAYIRENAHRIYVRAQVERGWASVALSELPDNLKNSETLRLAKRSVQPTMVVEP